MPEATTTDIGRIEPIPLEEEMASSYMQFAMSAIMVRALRLLGQGIPSLTANK